MLGPEEMNIIKAAFEEAKRIEADQIEQLAFQQRLEAENAGNPPVEANGTS
jgi:hypothetical protein